MTPAELDKLARLAADDWMHTPQDDRDFLARFAGLVRAVVLEEAAAHLMTMHAQAAAVHNHYHCAANEIRALAQRSGPE